MMMRFIHSTCLLVAITVFWPILAFAYIDPGTGSILIQGIIAAIAAIGVTLKLYWHRFVALFRRKSASVAKSEQSGHNLEQQDRNSD
jgi:uncharacterized membrane protein